ncbi:tetratricopeptide repeat protein [Streptomyces sp. NPDC004230]
MIDRFRKTAPPSTAPGVEASRGANAAGGDIINSVSQYIEYGTVLPAEAYAPISVNAVRDRQVMNIPRVDLFVGRAGQLAALDDSMPAGGGPDQARLRVITGLGGVGKSTFAAQWATHHCAARLRWWMPADSPTAIDAGLAKLARALKPGLAVLPEELQKERALAWLAASSQWLVVLDNVEDITHIRPLFDRAADGGCFLVTTRSATGWHHLGDTILLDAFAPQEAADLYERILTQDGPRDVAGMDETCAELGYLALAVEQAAAYCHEAGISPAHYLQLLRDWPADMFSTGPAAGDADRTLARIWHVTLDRLAATPFARRAFQMLAWCAPDHIPRSLLAGAATPPAVTTAIGRLVAYSLISDHHDGTLSMHRLVQAVARTPDFTDAHRQPGDIEAARDELARQLTTLLPEDADGPGDWATYAQLLPHVLSLAQATQAHQDSLSAADLFGKAGMFLLNRRAIDDGLALCVRSVAAHERLLGKDHVDTLAAVETLGFAYGLSGDHERSISLTEQNLADRIRVLGEDHPDTRISRHNLAYSYLDSGDVDRGLSLLDLNLSETVRSLGANHLETLDARRGLAQAYLKADDHARAIALLEQSLTDYLRVLGEDHPDTLDLRDDLAAAHLATDDSSQTVLLLERSLAERTRVLGQDHPKTLASCHNLAILLLPRDDVDRAMPLLEQNLTNRARVLGEDHPDTLTSRESLAVAYAMTDRLPKALPLLKQTLADRTRVLGENHPDTLTTREWLTLFNRLAAKNPSPKRSHRSKRGRR